MNFTVTDSINILARYGLSVSPTDLAVNSLKTVVVGLSGGVDSSVSALLLKLMNYRVIGIHMKNWTTCNPQDYLDVVAVADALDIPYYSVNLTSDYQTKVFDSFVKDLNAGLTPNPDILCNKYIKFDVFFKHALLLGADFVATGHYAKITPDNSALMQPVDLTKDQTYFLYAIDSSILSKVLFPLGNLTKKIVRQIAKDFNLPVATKKDSTGICFIDNTNFRKFISDYVSSTKGNFIDADGNVLGTHLGLPFYTIGQKKGLNLNFPRGSKIAKKYSALKLVVASKDVKTNTILLVPDTSSELKTRSFTFKDKTTSFTGDCLIRCRNLGDLIPATVDAKQVSFKNDVDLVAPGQALVMYSFDGVVLGGMTCT